ncbi:Glycosyltransferase involved in cell wall bisynthesis [Flavobacterium glycines]|uniref:Glycosyl transferase n=1 Tax=Flavobacterium glycines TaxID=551990 RepID=A0A1B9DHC6_9FLAO|nr:glycosyltransferase [Flavobacterium glycines]OCB69078.1 glycosyl transferase [Flavobacterium glycines]GEL11995.1 glycosyl transferase [Flavobacterium glycines]SDJ53957.1 Glycosyltransferase involved in cell wall bisynthesis [Flavobacterium glycines]
MRVLQIINSLGTGGAEKLLLDTIPLYRKEGVEMDLLLFWENNHPFTKALMDLNCCKVIVLNHSLNYKDIYSPRNILKLRKYLKDYDIAHVHLFPAQYFTVLANISLKNRCKLIFTEHSTSNRRINNRIFKPLESWIYTKYKKLVCITEEIKNIYDNYLKQFNTIEIIYNGVNIEMIQNAKSRNKEEIHPILTQEQKIILQVSAFRKGKDQMTLVKALQYLPENYYVVLVGEGDELKNCENHVIELGFDKRVVFLGQRMDIPRLLKTADIIVLSSKYEGLSLSSIEGMASGKPFVASDVPGLSEVVGGAGVLFELGNAKELAERIQELLEDKTLYERTVEACQNRAAQYDIQNMIQKHIELYQRVYAAT